MEAGIGYGRVSTDGQSLEAQEALLKAAGAERIFAEKISGARVRVMGSYANVAENSETTAKSDLGNCRLGRSFTPYARVRVMGCYILLEAHR